jgi:hypothetical protein
MHAGACLLGVGLALGACGGSARVAPPAPVANRASTAGPAYAGLFAPGAVWELPCQVRAYMSGRRTGQIVRTTTLRCRASGGQAVGPARVTHVVCDDDGWVDAQLTGWYLEDARGLWKLDNETSPMEVPIAPGGDPDEPRRIAASDVPKLALDHMLLAARAAPRTIDDRPSGDGMRIIIDTPVGAAWCVQQVSSYGGAPRWRTFCYEAGAGLVGASQANGEAGMEERCGMAPFAAFPLPQRPGS